MAVYIKVRATALIKIQDPYDLDTVREAEENTFLKSDYELIEENYEFEVEDVD